MLVVSNDYLYFIFLKHSNILFCSLFLHVTIKGLKTHTLTLPQMGLLAFTGDQLQSWNRRGWGFGLYLHPLWLKLNRECVKLFKEKGSRDLIHEDICVREWFPKCWGCLTKGQEYPEEKSGITESLQHCWKVGKFLELKNNNCETEQNNPSYPSGNNLGTLWQIFDFQRYSPPFRVKWAILVELSAPVVVVCLMSKVDPVWTLNVDLKTFIVPFKQISFPWMKARLKL